MRITINGQPADFSALIRKNAREENRKFIRQILDDVIKELDSDGHDKLATDIDCLKLNDIVVDAFAYVLSE